MIVGHGIDLFGIRRAEERLATAHGEWVEGTFTEAERAQADPEPHRAQYYAGRYAAKEAVVKALGTGFSDDIIWHDVEILRSATGAPTVSLSDGALEAAKALGVTGWFLSISHDDSYAIASAIAVAG
jgi:holo-[acyl-carrier protein] synthase